MHHRGDQRAESLGFVPKRQAVSVENMFSITCAQKMAKIEALPSELEAWEQRRKAESSKIRERLRRERSSKVVFPQGYGPAGRVPKYVESHIGLLEESPLARPCSRQDVAFSGLRAVGDLNPRRRRQGRGIMQNQIGQQ